MGELADRLSKLLEGGPVRFGELELWRAEDGICRTCHADDVGAADAALQGFDRVDDAREIAKLAADGSFRALKTSRSLRRGWLLRLPDAGALVQALDLLYPAALGQWLAGECGAIWVIPLRETLGRQSGRYRCSHKIDDHGIARVVAARCRAHCLRRILWPEGRILTDEISLREAERSIPLVCSEACNLLIADAAREVAFETKSPELQA